VLGALVAEVEIGRGGDLLGGGGVDLGVLGLLVGFEVDVVQFGASRSRGGNRRVSRLAVSATSPASASPARAILARSGFELIALALTFLDIGCGGNRLVEPSPRGGQSFDGLGDLAGAEPPWDVALLAGPVMGLGPLSGRLDLGGFGAITASTALTLSGRLGLSGPGACGLGDGAGPVGLEQLGGEVPRPFGSLGRRGDRSVGLAQFGCEAPSPFRRSGPVDGRGRAGPFGERLALPPSGTDGVAAPSASRGFLGEGDLGLGLEQLGLEQFGLDLRDGFGRGGPASASAPGPSGLTGRGNFPLGGWLGPRLSGG